MSKERMLTVVFCLLSVVAINLGQTGKSVFFYAPLAGFLTSFTFIILAAFMAAKAYAIEKK